MTRLLFLIFITLFTSSISGQVVEDKIKKNIENLKNANVDTLLIYSFYCNGGLIPFDSCLSEEPQFLFWRQEGKTFLQKFVYCKNYKAVELDTPNPLTFYLGYRRTIDKEDIKPPTYYEIKKRKNSSDTIMNSLTVSHSCFHQFSLLCGKQMTEKNVNTFNLNFIKFDNGKMNIYRKYNQQTKLYTLTLITSDLLKAFDNAKNFSAD